jgi:hypothetical protein
MYKGYGCFSITTSGAYMCGVVESITTSVMLFDNDHRDACIRGMDAFR